MNNHEQPPQIRFSPETQGDMGKTGQGKELAVHNPLTEQDTFYQAFWDRFMEKSSISPSGEDPAFWPLKMLHDFSYLVSEREYFTDPARYDLGEKLAPIQESLRRITTAYSIIAYPHCKKEGRRQCIEDLLELDRQIYGQDQVELNDTELEIVGRICKTPRASIRHDLLTPQPEIPFNPQKRIYHYTEVPISPAIDPYDRSYATEHTVRPEAPLQEGRQKDEENISAVGYIRKCSEVEEEIIKWQTEWQDRGNAPSSEAHKGVMPSHQEITRHEQRGLRLGAAHTPLTEEQGGWFEEDMPYDQLVQGFRSFLQERGKRLGGAYSPVEIVRSKLEWESDVKPFREERRNKERGAFFFQLRSAWDAIAYYQYEPGSPPEELAGVSLNMYYQHTREVGETSVVKLTPAQTRIIDALTEAVGIQHQKGQTTIEIAEKHRNRTKLVLSQEYQNKVLQVRKNRREQEKKNTYR